MTKQTEQTGTKANPEIVAADESVATATAKLLLNEQRREILAQIEQWLEAPLLFLGFAWLVLFIVEVVWGLSRFLQAVSTVIWIIFIVDFLIRFTLAPAKLDYLKQNWLTALSLAAPALRLLRIARLAQLLRLTRVAHGMTLLRIISSLNRGMRALGATMGRRGFGYVVLLTLIVGLVGAAGMLTFEGVSSGATGTTGFNGYSDALWWTAMALTTMGSDYSPQTPEGRILAFILALYAFAVFGYVTATLATFFVGRDTQSLADESADATDSALLRQEIAALREDMRLLREQGRNAS